MNHNTREPVPISGQTLGWLKRQWGWLRWPLALALLGWLFWLHREEFLRFHERRIAWPWAVLAFVLCGSSVVLTHVRWFLLVWAQEFDFSVRDAVRLGFLGYLFNYAAPGAAGGDVVKAVMLGRRQQSRRIIAMSTVVLDRIVGLVALFVVAGLAGLAATPVMARPEMKVVMGIFQAGGLIGLLALAVGLHPAIPRWRWLNRLVHLRYVGRPLGGALNALQLYQSRPAVLVVAVAMSLVVHVLMLSAFYCAALALHPAADIPGYVEHLQFVPAAELAGVIVPLPGGTGALEGAMSYYYGIAGASQADGFLTGIAYRALSVLLAAVGAAYYFASRQEIEVVLEQELHAPEAGS